MADCTRCGATDVTVQTTLNDDAFCEPCEVADRYEGLTPSQAITRALNDWRHDYPWPVDDPAIVIAVALAGIEAAGYEVVKPAFAVAPKTVYMGSNYDQFVTTVTPDKYRCLVVEK